MILPSTGLLNAPQLITIGALADASNPDPTSPEFSGNNGFVGLIDDIQVYARVISSGRGRGISYANRVQTSPTAWSPIMILTKARSWRRTCPATATTWSLRRFGSACRANCHQQR